MTSRRHPVEERHQLVLGHHLAGGVVRVADEDHARAIGDRRQHGLEVVALVRQQRHLDAGRTGDLRPDRVGLEAAPGVQHLVARPGGRRDDLAAHRDAARAERDRLRRHVEPLRDRVDQSARERIGVAVDVLGRPA